MKTRILPISLLVLFLLLSTSKQCLSFGAPPAQDHVMIQHLAPPPDDPEYQELLKRRDEARTPEERRRAEWAIERYAIKYTGRVFDQQQQELEAQANEIIEEAAVKVAQGEPAETVFLETKRSLSLLQVKAHRAWKGHGPEILEPALEKLTRAFKDHDYPIPNHNQSYRLTEVLENADLDYDMIQNIDSIRPPYPPGGKYQIGDLKTTSGNYKIYKFMAEYAGLSKFELKPITFHDLLIIKTDDQNRILDAYHYTLEWTDSPSLDLYHLTAKDLFLKNGLELKELGLKNREAGRLMQNGRTIF